MPEPPWLRSGLAISTAPIKPSAEAIGGRFQILRRTMLRLRFYSPGQGSAESIEPGEYFRFIGSMLCRGASNDAVATWMSGWLLRDAEFARAESMDPVIIYFENNAGLASCAYGPFEALHVADGAAWAGNRQLARLDPATLLWHPPRPRTAGPLCWSLPPASPGSTWPGSGDEAGPEAHSNTG